MPILASLVGSKIAVAAIALAALGGGATVVAAAGAHPAHPAAPSVLVTQAPAPGAEAVDPTAAPEPTPVPAGPDVTGPAAFGLCTAYLAGGVAAGSTPSGALIALAGDDGVGAYCDLVVADGNQSSHAGEHGRPAGAGAPPHQLPEQSEQGTSHRTEQHGK